MRHPSVISVCATLTTAGSVGAPRENSRSTCGITTAKSPSMSTETTSLPKITTKQMADQSQAGSTSYFADAPGPRTQVLFFVGLYRGHVRLPRCRQLFGRHWPLPRRTESRISFFAGKGPHTKDLEWWLLLYSRCGKKALTI